MFLTETTGGGIKLIHSSTIYPSGVGLIHVNREPLFANGVVLFAPGWFDVVIQESIAIPREFFLVESETGLVWSDKFKRKSIFLEGSTAGGEVTWHE